MARKTQNLKLKTQNYISKLKSFKSNKKFYLIILVLGILLLLFYKKSWFIAATVNGEPIPTFSLNQRLNALYKDRILNQIINEKLLEQEAFKQGVVVSPQEVQQKVDEAQAQYGGKETFDMLLSQQGLTKDEFIRQTRLQVLVEKLYAGESSPSAEEIQKFVADNQNIPEATDEAKFKKLAEQSVRSDKLSKVFSEKFQALRQNAKIQIF